MIETQQLKRTQNMFHFKGNYAFIYSKQKDAEETFIKKSIWQTFTFNNLHVSWVENICFQLRCFDKLKISVKMIYRKTTATFRMPIETAQHHLV